MRKNRLIRLLLKVVILAIIMIYIVQSRKSLFSPGKPETSATKPLMTDEDEGQRFRWVPRFPGAEPEQIRKARTHEEVSYGYRFQTKQEPPKIVAFYETTLQRAGFTVTKKSDQSELHAESPDRKRALDLTLEKTPSGTEAGVAAVER